MTAHHNTEKPSSGLEAWHGAITIAAGNPARFMTLLVVIAVPVLCAMWFVPPWIGAILSACVAPLAILAMVVARSMTAHGKVAAPARGMRAEALILDMSEHLGRWTSTSEESGSDLRLAQGEVAAVIDDIHSAVMAIGATFRDLMKKTAMQREYALTLLNSVVQQDLEPGTREAIRAFDGLGKEINADIRRIVVAMQFQDITQQKLERVHQPVLNRVIQELRTVADESWDLRNEASELVGRDAVLLRTGSDRVERAARAGAPANGRGTAASEAAGGRVVRGYAQGNDVELF